MFRLFFTEDHILSFTHKEMVKIKNKASACPLFTVFQKSTGFWTHLWYFICVGGFSSIYHLKIELEKFRVRADSCHTPTTNLPAATSLIGPSYDSKTHGFPKIHGIFILWPWKPMVFSKPWKWSNLHSLRMQVKTMGFFMVLKNHGLFFILWPASKLWFLKSLFFSSSCRQRDNDGATKKQKIIK